MEREKATKIATTTKTERDTERSKQDPTKEREKATKIATTTTTERKKK